MKLVFLLLGVIATSVLSNDDNAIRILENGNETYGISTNSSGFDDIVSKVEMMNLTSHQFDELVRVLNMSRPKEAEAHDEHSGEFHLISFNWDYVMREYVITVFMITIGLIKIVYHKTRFTRKIIPESCLLIILGFIFGLFYINDTSHQSLRFLEFSEKSFFFFLLPPIILEAAYSLKDRAFIDNLGTILLYAVVGTVLNILLFAVLTIGALYFGIFSDTKLTVADVFGFSSIIAAVDPVAVLAIFQEVGVNKMLYFMVFGESLFNDAVTIVCYNLAIDLEQLPELYWFHFFLGVLKFLIVSLGGFGIGAAFGFLSSLITKWTKQVRVCEPVVLFGLAYTSYLSSEMFHLSGIIALITCGLIQSHYAMGNISYKSFSCVMYCTKIMSTFAESLIFIILGVMIVYEREWFWSDWHPEFTVWSIVLCVLVRFIVTFSLTYIVNQFTGGVRYISFEEQFIMSYGGLRGAVSFSLIFMFQAPPEVKNTLLGATYGVILFTNFIQGSTIKLFVKWLNIRLAPQESHFRLFAEFNSGMVENLSSGIEAICADDNKTFVSRASELSKKYVRPYVEKGYDANAKKERLVEMNKAFTMREALINSPSQSSFKRQQTFDEMAESGVLPHDFLDDDHHGGHHGHHGAHHGAHPTHGHRGQLHPSSDEVEQRTDELIKDVSSIRQLLHSPFEECYLDRNLIHEGEKEQAREKMKSLKSKASRLSAIRKSMGFFGKKKSVRRNATQQGLIHSAIATLGVHSVKENQPSTSTRVSVEDEEEGLNMRPVEEEHPLNTINESEDETAC